VREIVEGAGCGLVYLPPYSPDLNPIERAFSKAKGLLRKTQARTRVALIEAMGRVLWLRLPPDGPTAIWQLHLANDGLAENLIWPE
jgi:transposase